MAVNNYGNLKLHGKSGKSKHTAVLYMALTYSTERENGYKCS